MGLFGRRAQQLTKPAWEVTNNLREAESRYVEILRREISNLIVEFDPELMVRSYQKAWTWEQETALNPDRLRADEAALVAKLPMFEDFDLIGTRHFVPYPEGRRSLTDDDLVERYLELSRMLVFMRNRLQPDVARRRPLHDEREHKLLLDTMGRLKDRHFRNRIAEAWQLCYAYRQGFDAGKGDPFAATRETFADAEVEVFSLPFNLTPDIETGIVFKKTDEYGVYAYFVHDDGRKSESYYRTDQQFARRDRV
ncbi:hypothetical protein MKK70_09115 [Methylobacterium sp. E-041]|uniref:hypothetical protein n=1 Tax=Methylobacterium sp. E-041 TaxID=2836573 RepID=UPI001FBBF00C|nr:hypothetical protein [Methylobacterium sp. E-041]MCJ2105537.1 hypothetical protein [Methylobacterium sp. E-041]